MIGYLSGNIINKYSHCVIIIVNGVGYRVYVTENLFELSKIDSPLSVHVYTHVREDTLDLFGFEKIEELSMFEMLISVSGIGPKTALLVLNRGVDSIQKAIVKANADFFQTIPRLGKKNSQKIIIELKNKMGGIADLDLSSESEENKEVVDALYSMGYQKKDILLCLKKIPSDIEKEEEKIKCVLKSLGRKRHE